MIDLDYIFDDVKNKTITKKEAYELVKNIGDSMTFTTSKHTSTDVYVEIAKKIPDDDLIETMINSQIENYRSSQGIYRLLDLASKTFFEKKWDEAINQPGGYYLNYYKSKHTDGEKLYYLWTHILKKKPAAKNWKEKLKQGILSHPNCPPKITNRQLRNLDNIHIIALNKNLASNPKALKAVGDYAAVFRHDGIFENLTRNKYVPWEKISEVVDMKNQVKAMMTPSVPVTFRRKAAILEFFRREDTPDKAREVMYKITGDDEFLPKEVRDLFIF